MHECDNCGYMCDCDGEDHGQPQPDDCGCNCCLSCCQPAGLCNCPDDEADPRLAKDPE